MRRTRSLLIPTLALLAACAAANARWDERTLPNVPTPTLGGLQVWADVRWRDGWRVQRHVWTGHHRLLDAGGVRRAWGRLGACEAALDRLVAPVATPRLAVLVHGLARTRTSLEGVAEDLERAGVRCVRVSTASTRRAPAEAAVDLAALLDHVEGLERVVFVTHSLGSLVVRELLARDDPWRSRATVENAVLIAPPSTGARLARELRATAVVGPAVELILGEAFAVLARPAAEVAPTWPADVPVLVVAGSRGTRFGWNPLVPGDDDGVVGVRETSLPGCDHLVVRGVHTYLMNHGSVRERIVARLGPKPKPEPGALRVPCRDADKRGDESESPGVGSFDLTRRLPVPNLPFPRAARLALAGVLLAPAVLLRSPVDDEPGPLAEPAPAVALRPPGLSGLEDFACTECHASIVDEWASTAHAIAWKDEVYRAALSERKNPGLCTSCHIPGPLLVTGEIKRPRAREVDLHHGVDCAACHLGPDGTWLGPHGAPTDAHATAASEHFTTPGSNALCARCHATNIGPVIGIAKDFEAAGLAERGLSCVGCHLAPLPRASEDEPLRRSHALQTPRDPSFLRRAFHVRRSAAGLVVENRAGHRVPGLIGREIRLRAQALDADGAVVAEVERTLDARAHLVVDGSFELELTGTRIRVLGDHLDPREPERWVRFLEEDLE